MSVVVVVRVLAHLWVRRFLFSSLLVAEPPVHEYPPELHVEDDGVASEEADLLLQHGSFLSPGHVMTLKALQLQTFTLGLQTHAVILILQKKKKKIIDKDLVQKCNS